MIINIRVVPNAKKKQVKEEDGRLKVYLSAPAVEGKANKALVEFLAEYYKIRRSLVSIIKGEKSKDKVVEIRKG